MIKYPTGIFGNKIYSNELAIYIYIYISLSLSIHYIILYYIMLCYVILYYIVLYYIILYYIILYVKKGLRPLPPTPGPGGSCLWETE